MSSILVPNFISKACTALARSLLLRLALSVADATLARWPSDVPTMEARKSFRAQAPVMAAAIRSSRAECFIATTMIL
jgi:hypothetical protein